LCPHFIVPVLPLVILKINYFINNLLLIIFLQISFVLNYYLKFCLHILFFYFCLIYIYSITIKGIPLFVSTFYNTRFTLSYFKN